MASIRALLVRPLLFVFAAALLATAPACKKALTPDEEVHAAALDAMQYLEQRRFADFLDRWPTPEDKKQLLEGSTLEKRAADFARGPANKLLDKLRKASVGAPKWNEAKTEAAFVISDNDPEFVLVKQDGRWYIRN